MQCAARTPLLRGPVVTAALVSLAAALALLPALATVAPRQPAASPGARARPFPAHAGLSSLPATAQGAVSAALGAELPAYRIGASRGALRAVAPAQHLQEAFDRSRVLVSCGAVRLGLAARAIGFGTSLHPLRGVSPGAIANRVTYRRRGLSEWYLNGPLGLEQGFEVPSAPPGDPARPLTLALALSGNARAAIDQRGRGLVFSDAAGPRLRYSGLTATDARARTLRSWLALRGGRLLLQVDARGARYPLRLDPFIQQAGKLTGAEESGAGEFGYSVALSADGDTALIGGAGDNGRIGAAWVFTRAGGAWAQQGPKLTGVEEGGAAWFGFGVALSADGNTALIGGPLDDGSKGAAWVFTRAGGAWAQQGRKLIATGESGAGGFGWSVALSADGSAALIGASDDASFNGAAWSFSRSGSRWAQQGAKLTAADEDGPSEFGYGVALSADGNTALIGGNGDNEEAGAAWVFVRSFGAWVQQGEKLTGADESGEAEFGASVALSADGNTALVGGYADSGARGAAWVFGRSRGAWTQQGAKLTGADESGAGQFGTSLALSGDGNTALIGGPADGGGGAAWVFTRSETFWTQKGPKLTGSEQGPSGRFGESVALSADGNTALIGARADAAQAGAAWTFVNAPTLTVLLAGSGTGIVAGSGIFCPGICSVSYAPGTVVALVPVPDPGSAFAGWGGSCAGSGFCLVTMISDQCVTAFFTAPGPATSGSQGCPAPLPRPRPVKLTALRESHSVFTVGRHSAPLAGRAAAKSRRRHQHQGTVFSFRLDAQATVTIAIGPAVGARHGQQLCSPEGRRGRRRPPCRTLTSALLTRSADAGRNEVAFSGRIGGRPFRLGRYRARFTAIGAGGPSPSQSLTFTIVRR